MVRSSEIRKSLNIKPLLLRIERSQRRWFVHASRMPHERHPKPALLPKQKGEDQFDDLELDGPITGVAKVFDWGDGRANHNSHAMTSSEIFKRVTFYGERYRRKKDYKPWPGLTLKQDFAKERKKETNH